MPDAPSFPTLPVLDTHAAPDGAAAGSNVHDLALGTPRRIGEVIRRGLAHALVRAEADRAGARISAINPTATADRQTAGETR